MFEFSALGVKNRIHAELLLAATEKIAPAEPLGELILKGLHNPVSAYNVIARDI